jgi:phage recombination protein Bet
MKETVINMTTELTVKQFTTEQLQLITNTVARGATRDELDLFLYRCKEMGLNPLKPGQIHFIKYGATATIVVGIEGLRSIAGRSGNLLSTNRGVIKSEKGEIISGWCRIKKLGQNGTEQEFYEETPFNEYFNDKNPSWRKFPETMIKKCAEAACLRMSDSNCGGIYIMEEKDAIEAVNGPVVTSQRIAPDQPTADDSSKEGEAIFKEKYGYLIPFGSRKHRKFSELSIDEINRMIFSTSEYLAAGKVYAHSSVEQMKEFVDKANQHIKQIEASAP